MLRFFSSQKDNNQAETDWDDLLLNPSSEVDGSINLKSKSNWSKVFIPLFGIILSLVLINTGEYVFGKLSAGSGRAWVEKVGSVNLELPNWSVVEKIKPLASRISDPLFLISKSEVSSRSLNQTLWNSVKNGETIVRHGMISSVALFDSFFSAATVNIKSSSGSFWYRTRDGLALSLLPIKSWFDQSWLVIGDMSSWIRSKFSDLAYNLGYYWNRLVGNWRSFVGRESPDDESIDVENLRQSLKMEILAEIEEELSGLFSSGQEPKPVMVDSGDGQGVVVVPLTQETDQQKVKTDIQDMFSDPVNIDFEADGQSGIITPIFRGSTGNNYIFILTPIRNK